MAHPKAGRPLEAHPVKLISAVLFESGFDVSGILFPELERGLGGIDYKGRPRPFTVTDYYTDEMGESLERLVVSFEDLISPTEIIRVKLFTAEIEQMFSGGGGRRVNVDPGYMDYYKVVLASFKEGPQKIYIGEGVYADPVLLFQSGAFAPLPWSFPDFREGAYTDDLSAIRKLYKKARRGA